MSVRAHVVATGGQVPLDKHRAPSGCLATHLVANSESTLIAALSRRLENELDFQPPPSRYHAGRETQDAEVVGLRPVV